MSAKSDEFSGVLISVKQGAIASHSNGEPWEVSQLREAYKGFNQYLSAIMPMRTDIVIEKVSLGGVTTHLAKAPHTAKRRILYVHGGYYLLDINALSEAYLGFAAELADSCGADVYAVDYAVAPEKPFPASINDVYTAYLALVEQTGTADDIVLVGDSVGGGMVISLLMKLRDEGKALPRATVAISPLADMAGTGESMVSKADSDIVIIPAMLKSVRPLVVDDAHIKHPDISAVYGDFHDLPPLMLLLGENEVLFDDSKRVEEKAKASGVDVTLDVTQGMAHIFPLFAGIYDEGKLAIARIAKFIQAHS